MEVEHFDAKNGNKLTSLVAEVCDVKKYNSK
jgi:hypothetical protein